MKNLTNDELKRLKCYTIAKSKNNDGCGVKLKVVALSGARVAFNIETDYRIAMIRLDELSKVIDVSHLLQFPLIGENPEIYISKGELTYEKVQCYC